MDTVNINGVVLVQDENQPTKFMVDKKESKIDQNFQGHAIVQGAEFECGGKTYTVRSIFPHMIFADPVVAAVAPKPKPKPAKEAPAKKE